MAYTGPVNRVAIALCERAQLIGNVDAAAVFSASGFAPVICKVKGLLCVAEFTVNSH